MPDPRPSDPIAPLSDDAEVASLPRIVLDGAGRSGEVQHRVEGGWPTFEVTLTYHVETDDPVAGPCAALHFFAEANWPLNNDDQQRAALGREGH